MKSVRLGQELQHRLAETAHALGVSESEVIRMAVERFCEIHVPRRSGADAMVALIEQWEREDAGQPALDVAQHSGELFGELLRRDWRKQEERLLRVAEDREDYQQQSPD
ncbi:MAG TPA: CopG family transcriptional regulator [Chloroflexota bacterium]